MNSFPSGHLTSLQRSNVHEVWTTLDRRYTNVACSLGFIWFTVCVFRELHVNSIGVTVDASHQPVARMLSDCLSVVVLVP